MITYLNIVSTLECSDLFLHSAVRLYVMAHYYAQRQLCLPKELRLGYLWLNAMGVTWSIYVGNVYRVQIYTGGFMLYLFRAIIMLFIVKTDQLRVWILQRLQFLYVQFRGIKYIRYTGNIRTDRLQGNISCLLHTAVSTPSDMTSSETAKTRVLPASRQPKSKKHRHATMLLEGFETAIPGH
jgi:hypothetical protein